MQVKPDTGIKPRRVHQPTFFSAEASRRPNNILQYLWDGVHTRNNSGKLPLPPTRIYPEMEPAAVSMVGVKGSVEEAVREAVAAAGGMDDFEKGQRVMIKPNAGAPFVSTCTSHEVIRAVIRMVKERGCHALVGDRSAFSNEQTMRKAGFARLCLEEGAEFFPWVRSSYVWFFPRQRHWTEGFRFPKILTEVDHWINVPILKNHQSANAEFTCCLKSFVGLCHPADRFQKGDNTLHQWNISEKVAELNLCSRPALNIIDATRVMLKGGPDGVMARPVWARAGLIIAGRDRVACDSWGLAVLKFYGAEAKMKLPYVQKSIWDQVQIYRSAELGIGQADPAKISIIESSAPEFSSIKANWV